ncbi:MAG: co-chaperone GroES family protein [Prevotellaceae bacterium]|jgi:co-chaperonin GroES (HSP10)|nr:co-chaperone GroES family protein [Prevotellaceae bacterium]
MLSLSYEELNNVILIGDKVLIKPRAEQERTKSGLYLPPGVEEKEPVLSGYVVKTGPGYPIPAVTDENEAWKSKGEEIKYVPLQPQQGDLAVFLQNSTWRIEFNDEKYLIVPHGAILMLIRNESIFK